MKKSILAMAIIATLTVVSCSKKEEAVKTEDNSTTATSTETGSSTSASTEMSAETPAGLVKTGDAKIDAVLTEYVTLLDELSAAAKNKDQAKMMELVKKSQEIQTKLGEIAPAIQKLPVDVQTKVQKFIQDKAMEMSQAMQAK